MIKHENNQPLKLAVSISLSCILLGLAFADRSFAQHTEDLSHSQENTLLVWAGDKATRRRISLRW